jgi:4-alpha-glucanotransferase
MERSSGTLMHITSLPARFGIGTMGRAAFEFVDFLVQAGLKYWQVLPIHPTGYGDSPYQSFSTYAGNPYLIDLESLCADGLLKMSECEGFNWGEDPLRVDFEKISANKFTVLKKAFERGFDPSDQAYGRFCEKNAFWLSDYAVFMAAKEQSGMRPWKSWDDEKLILHEDEAVRAFAKKNKRGVDFYQYLQYLFFGQWTTLKKYANENGIRLIGDIPIYVAADSADAWGNREMFRFNENNDSIHVAGCPPDFFSSDGQYWGNPLYDWDYLEDTNYGWWIRRLENLGRLYDAVRIDHFRGFEAYYSIKYGAENARDGHWVKGPGMDFFVRVKESLPDLSIIAEDLGYLTEEVHRLRKKTGYPGMKVLQFAFDSGSDSAYLPHNYERNCVVYTGTHDNDTTAGWFESAPEQKTRFAKEYGALTEAEGLHWGMIRLAFSSVADLAVVPMQDFLGLPSFARMNMPSTLGGNWTWRAGADYAAFGLVQKIRECADRYGRI